jgi:hypothetical protein
MQDEADQEYVSHLGSTQRGVRLEADPRTYKIGKPISDDRYDSHKADAAFLDEVFTRSAFADLQGRCMDFMRAASAAVEAFQSGQSTSELTPPIRSRFDDLLSAFRRFVDRTPHALSQRYGSKSREITTFKQATSHEFDNEFAYRFIYHLRNYSDHKGSPISRIKQASRVTSDGTVEHDFDVLFDSATLLPNHDWHKRVREDLRRINGEFSAVITVDSLLYSCGRIHCKSLLAQEVSIVAAIENIRILANETPSDSDFGPVFIRIKPQELISRPISPFTVMVIRTDLADVAEAALKQARSVVGS